jgi:hypothetical protein
MELQKGFINKKPSKESIEVNFFRQMLRYSHLFDLDQIHLIGTATALLPCQKLNLSTIPLIKTLIQELPNITEERLPKTKQLIKKFLSEIKEELGVLYTTDYIKKVIAGNLCAIEDLKLVSNEIIKKLNQEETFAICKIYLNHKDLKNASNLFKMNLERNEYTECQNKNIDTFLELTLKHVILDLTDSKNWENGLYFLDLIIKNGKEISKTSLEQFLNIIEKITKKNEITTKTLILNTLVSKNPKTILNLLKMAEIFINNFSTCIALIAGFKEIIKKIILENSNHFTPYLNQLDEGLILDLFNEFIVNSSKENGYLKIASKPFLKGKSKDFLKIYYILSQSKNFFTQEQFLANKLEAVKCENQELLNLLEQIDKDNVVINLIKIDIGLHVFDRPYENRSNFVFEIILPIFKELLETETPKEIRGIISAHFSVLCKNYFFENPKLIDFQAILKWIFSLQPTELIHKAYYFFAMILPFSTIYKTKPGELLNICLDFADQALKMNDSDLTESFMQLFLKAPNELELPLNFLLKNFDIEENSLNKRQEEESLGRLQLAFAIKLLNCTSLFHLLNEEHQKLYFDKLSALFVKNPVKLSQNNLKTFCHFLIFFGNLKVTKSSLDSLDSYAFWEEYLSALLKSSSKNIQNEVKEFYVKFLEELKDHHEKSPLTLDSIEYFISIASGILNRCDKKKSVFIDLSLTFSTIRLYLIFETMKLVKSTNRYSYTLLNRMIALMQKIKMIPKEETVLYESVISDVCYYAAKSKILKPILLCKEFIIPSLSTKTYLDSLSLLSVGLLNIDQTENVARAFEAVAKISDHLLEAAKKLGALSQYFSYGKTLIEVMVNRCIELDLGRDYGRQIHGNIADKKFNRGIPSENYLLDLDAEKKNSKKYCLKTIEAMNNFIQIHINRIQEHTEELKENKKNIKELLFWEIDNLKFRLQCYHIEELDKEKINYYASSTFSHLFISNYIALARNQLIYLENEGYQPKEDNDEVAFSKIEVVDNILEISDVKLSFRDLKIYIKQILVQDIIKGKYSPLILIALLKEAGLDELTVDVWLGLADFNNKKLKGECRAQTIWSLSLFIHEFLHSPNKNNQKLALSLIESLKEMGLSERERINIITESISRVMDGPDLCQEETFKNIVLYLIDKYLFNEPFTNEANFINKNLVTLNHKKFSSSSENFQSWSDYIASIKDIFYFKFVLISIETNDINTSRSEILCELDKYYLEKEEKSSVYQDLEVINKPKFSSEDLCTRYDQLVSSLFRCAFELYWEKPLWKEKEKSNKIEIKVEDLISNKAALGKLFRAFKFFRDCGYLSNVKELSETFFVNLPSEYKLQEELAKKKF